MPGGHPLPSRERGKKEKERGVRGKKKVGVVRKSVRWMFWAGVFGILAVAGYIAYAYLSVPDIAALKKAIPKTTAMQAYKEARVLEKGKKPFRRQQVVPLGAISPYLRWAVVASEDANFWGHEGVDYDALKEAAKKDWKKRRMAMGGSTIPMQLAKNLYLSPTKNPLRKIREYFIALKLDEVLTKARILEVYLNVVEWGPGVWGAQAASRYCFGKDASALAPSEACLLAVMLPNPITRDPHVNRSRSLVWKRDRLLKILLKQGRISQEEYRRGTSEPIALKGAAPWP
jgi:monofunctional biosynthetic peptidoglycan transglycosylase